MTRLFVVPLLFFSYTAAPAQPTSRIDHVRLSVDEATFGSCSQVESLAERAVPSTGDAVYTVEVSSREKSSFAVPFLSDRSTGQVAQWIAEQAPKAYPFAMLYKINGRYAFRCRDSRDRLSETHDASGNPLDLSLVGGHGVIWHFDLYNSHMAHVYVVTNMSLGQINGDQVLDQVTKLLQARYVFLYIRRDPWFLGYSLDAAPYVFSDSSKLLDDAAYRASLTLACVTNQGCQVGSSRE